MQDEDEDKPTVVIDFEAMKEELKNEENLTCADILFSVTDSNAEAFSDEGNGNKSYDFNIYLFDFNTDYFQKNYTLLNISEGLGILTTLPELNQTLTNDPASLVVFYYNGHPKAVNQLCAQIRAKFSQARTLIVAEKLSPQKAQAHAKTKYRADTYLSTPLTSSAFDSAIKKIDWN